MSAADDLRNAAEVLGRADSPSLTDGMVDALADLLYDFAEGYEWLEEMYADAEDAAESQRGFVSALTLARLINGGAS